MNNRRFPAKIKVDLNSTTVWLSFPEVCPLTVPFLVSFLDNVTFLLELNALLKRICDFYETSVYYPRACEVCPLYSKLPWGKPKTNNSNRHVILFYFFHFPLMTYSKAHGSLLACFFLPPPDKFVSQHGHSSKNSHSEWGEEDGRRVELSKINRIKSESCAEMLFLYVMTWEVQLGKTQNKQT